MDKTLVLVSRDIQWPNMIPFIPDLVGSSLSCGQNRTVRHKKFAPLEPLELADVPGDSIAMHFITHHPDSKEYTSIWIMVDSFSKIAHVIPLRTGKSRPEHLIREIWQLHCLPTCIITDRDLPLMSAFRSSVCEQPDKKERMSTMLHHQTES